ncbi:MAG: TIGR03032 family protein, partial [Pseudomonadota bacterium]
MAEALHSQHTSTFLDFLNQARASLVVSTYQAGKLILLRADQDSVNTHFVNLAKPMGVAYQEGRLSVGSGAQVIDYFNMNNVGPKVEPLNKHDGAFLPRRTHVTGDIDIHEMGFDDDNELWIVNTKMSCLCTLNINHSIVPRWKPPFITGYDLTDRCHLNGLGMRDGKPKYVSALGTTDTAGGWRDNKAFGGMIMDIDSNEMIIEGLSMPHSPRWYQDKLWVLESGAGQLVVVDEKTGAKNVVAEVPGFCRGIDFIQNYAVIGLSEVRETAVFAGLPLTEREQDRKCGIWIVDINTGATVAFLAFSGGVQEIFSVQIIPWVYPALLDLSDPLLRSSYSIPDEALKDFTPPDPKQLEIERAIALHRRKEYVQAIDAYKKILSSDPDNRIIQYHAGVAYSDIEQWDDAIAVLEKVV